MARKNVYVPDDLAAQLAEHRPDVNVSRVLQDALRAVLGDGCGHEHLTCSDCGRDVARAKVDGEAVGAFYRELLHELGPLVDQLGTAEGAARVAKRLAVEFGAAGAEHRSLPRPPRAAREARR